MSDDLATLPMMATGEMDSSEEQEWDQMQQLQSTIDEIRNFSLIKFRNRHNIKKLGKKAVQYAFSARRYAEQKNKKDPNPLRIVKEAFEQFKKAVLAKNVDNIEFPIYEAPGVFYTMDFANILVGEQPDDRYIGGIFDDPPLDAPLVLAYPNKKSSPKIRMKHYSRKNQGKPIVIDVDALTSPEEEVHPTTPPIRRRRKPIKQETRPITPPLRRRPKKKRRELSPSQPQSPPFTLGELFPPPSQSQSPPPTPMVRRRPKKKKKKEQNVRIPVNKDTIVSIFKNIALQARHETEMEFPDLSEGDDELRRMTQKKYNDLLREFEDCVANFRYLTPFEYSTHSVDEIINGLGPFEPEINELTPWQRKMYRRNLK